MVTKNKYPSIKEIARAVSKKANVPYEECLAVLEKLPQKLKKALLEEKQVKIKEFGSFNITNWETEGIFNPNVGLKEAKKVRTVKFKPSGALKEKVL